MHNKPSTDYPGSRDDTKPTNRRLIRLCGPEYHWRSSPTGFPIDNRNQSVEDRTLFVLCGERRNSPLNSVSRFFAYSRTSVIRIDRYRAQFRLTIVRVEFFYTKKIFRAKILQIQHIWINSLFDVNKHLSGLNKFKYNKYLM